MGQNMSFNFHEILLNCFLKNCEFSYFFFIFAKIRGMPSLLRPENACNFTNFPETHSADIKTLLAAEA